MKIKPGFEIQNVCGENILLGMGEANIDFSKVIYLNETSLFVWNKMKEGLDNVDAIVDAMMEEYDVDKETATKDVEKLIDELVEHGVAEK